MMGACGVGGEPRCSGDASWSIPPNVELVRATEEAFAALHKDGFVTVRGNPHLGGDIALVRAELH